MPVVHHAPFTVAVAQVAPVFLDRTATLEKACELMVDAGDAGARLIVFPTAFLPGYPVWAWSIPPGEHSLLSDLYAHLLANAVSIPSDTTDRLCRIAQRARINVVMGMSERDTESSSTTCYNTLLYINAQGHILGKHRSLLLTGAERLVWAQGDGSTLQVHQLPFGTLDGSVESITCHWHVTLCMRGVRSSISPLQQMPGNPGSRRCGILPERDASL